jgi:hypothetical protein
MLAAKPTLERVLMDTHSDAKALTRLIGKSNVDKFIALYEDNLVGGIETSVSETEDALKSIVVACENWPDADSLIRVDDDSKRTRRIKALLGEILDHAKVLEQSIDGLNAMSKFLGGLGALGHEFCGKDVTYYNSSEDVIVFFERVVKFIKSMPEDIRDDAGPVLGRLIVGSVTYSSSIVSATKHLEIIEEDLKG